MRVFSCISKRTWRQRNSSDLMIIWGRTVHVAAWSRVWWQIINGLNILFALLLCGCIKLPVVGTGHRRICIFLSLFIIFLRVLYCLSFVLSSCVSSCSSLSLHFFSVHLLLFCSFSSLIPSLFLFMYIVFLFYFLRSFVPFVLCVFFLPLVLFSFLIFSHSSFLLIFCLPIASSSLPSCFTSFLPSSLVHTLFLSVFFSLSSLRSFRYNFIPNVFLWPCPNEHHYDETGCEWVLSPHSAMHHFATSGTTPKVISDTHLNSCHLH